MATKAGNKGEAAKQNKGGKTAPAQQAAGGYKGKNDNQNKDRRGGNGPQGGNPNFKNKYPNQPAFEAEQKAFDAAGKSVDAKINQIKAQQALIDDLIKERSQLDSSIDKLRKKLQEEGVPAEKAKGQKKAINDQITQKKTAIDNLKKEIEDIKKTNNINPKPKETLADTVKRGLEAIEQEKRDLDEQVRSSSSLSEQKKVISNIEKLSDKRKKIQSLADKQQEFDTLRSERKQLYDELEVVRKTAKETGDKRQATYQQLNETIKKKNDELNPKITELIKIRDGFQQEIEALKTEKQEKYLALKAKRDEWRKEQDAIKKAAYEERQREKEERARQAEEKKKQLELEGKLDEAAALEASTIKLPHIEEIKAIEQLVAYTKGLKPNKKKPKAGFKHSLDTLSEFSKYGLFPPQNGTQIEGSLTALQAKIDGFVKLQKEYAEKETARRAEEKAKQEAKAAAEKKEESSKELPASDAAPAAEAAPAAPAAAPAEEVKAEQPKEAPAAQPAPEAKQDEPAATPASEPKAE